MGKQAQRPAAWVKPARTVQKGSQKGSVRPPAKQGKGGGSWVYVPKGVAINQVVPKKGSGRGSPVPAAKPKLSKYEEKLKKIDSSLKVWIGGLTEGTTWKEVEELFSTVAKPSVTDIMKRGTAVVAYKTVEDVETAVATLNGSELKGATIEVDVWVQKPKTEKTEKPKKVQKVQKPQQKQQLQPKAKKAAQPVIKTASKRQAGDDKMKEKLAAFSAAQKVWVGNLAESTTWKALEKHLAEVAKPKVTHIWKGKGCVAYESEDEVATVIATLNGSELDGKVLEVDTWTKPERKAKAGKADV